jgi:ArsR family transcriptional regulator, arsenate/arsenite/antimonite-responsive transcriptional repressor
VVKIRDSPQLHEMGKMKKQELESEQAIMTLAALAQSTRLEVFRLLMKQEPEGLAAGDIARELAIPHNTLSSHLAILARANLVRSARESRSIIYRAQLDSLEALIVYLLRDCCGGRPELCASLIESLKPCCPPKRGSNVRARV